MVCQVTKRLMVRSARADSDLLELCAQTARALLDKVPQKYLIGLKEVVITEVQTASKSLRISAEKSRLKKGLLFGAYFPKDGESWIEIYVDNLVTRFGSRVLNHPKGRELAISMCLYHELGHHIARWLERRRQPTEADAIRWERRLSDEFVDVRSLETLVGSLGTSRRPSK
jgi:hypothetical protein